MDDSERELWRRYARDGDRLARDHLFLTYAGWARAIVATAMRRMPRLGLEWDDHVQNAHVGLLEAMSRFDVERGIDFMAYAKQRVRGAIFNGLRKATAMEPLGDEEAWRDRAESLLPERPADPLQAFLDLVIGTGLAHLLGATSGEGERAEVGPSRGVLEDVLLDLPARSRDILIAHYYRGTPFMQLARELSLTKGRVSQLHKAALMQLREGLRRRRYDRDSFF
jgi:RNA polymerase sigma factor for flagellar operon FliA